MAPAHVALRWLPPAPVALRWLPPAAAVVYAVVLVHRLPSIVSHLTWNADYASPMVIAESVGSNGKAGRAIVGQVGYFWFDLATRWLPFHRQVWEYSPYATALLALGLLGWTAARLRGREAGVLTVALGLAASPLVLATQAAQAYHGTTWLGIAALAAYLCWLLTTKAGNRTRWVLVAAVAVAIGLATASDPLLAPTGVVPFGAAVALVRLARPKEVNRRIVATALSTVVAAGAVGGAFALANRLAGYTSSVPRGLTHLVTPAHLRGNVRQLVEGIFEVGGMPPSVTAEGVVLGLLLLAGALVPIVWLIASVRGKTPAPLIAVVSFWSASGLFLAAGFVFSDVPADFLQTSSRYLVSIFYVAVATVPLWAAGSSRRLGLVAVPAAVFIVAQAAAVDASAAAGPYPTRLDVAIAYLEQHGLTRGYASYWEASPMTWKSNLAVHVYPVTEQFITVDDRCRPQGAETVCPFTYNSVSDWYASASGPTFILIDPTVQYLHQPPADGLEPPAVIYRVDRFVIYVYNDDVASRMGTPRKFTRPLF
jgi:hypothetical protein